MANIYIGQTDNSWFDFLYERQPFEEINFWKPSVQHFRVIEEGELFFFRLKSPRGVIGGYGTLVSSINAPIQLAWESLGEANGVASLDRMVQALAQYRGSQPTHAQSHIGCRILANPVFLDEHEWVEVPTGWANSIVSGKSYDAADPAVRHMIDLVETRRTFSDKFSEGRREFEGLGSGVQVGYSAPSEVRRRLGQNSFRMRIASAYAFECALSGTRVLPALEAAHIVPFSVSRSHAVDNGILMRRDIHSVFDSGYITFNPDQTLRVSSQLKTVFNNGNEYRQLAGTKLRAPNEAAMSPNREFLSWHRENKYVGD